jgi:hypothetical protein
LNPNEDPGATCNQDGGAVCDGDGNCVECNENEDCGVDEVCVVNICFGDPDLFCNENLCENDTAARADCIDTFLTCVAKEPTDEEGCAVLARRQCNECNGDSDCAEGQVCDENNECVTAPDCVSAGDCIDGNICTIGVCTDGMCSFDPVEGGSCDSGTGSGDGTCDDSGNCVSDDDCDTNDDCPDDDGNECTVPLCNTSGAPYVCIESSEPADGNECQGGSGTCQGGDCVVATPPYINAGTDDAGYRRICLGTPNGSWPYIDSGDSPTGGTGTCSLCLSDSCSGGSEAGNACNVDGDCPGGNCIPTSPSNEEQCALDCFTYVCGTADPTLLFPGGGPSGACSYPSVSTNCPVRGCEVVSNTLKLQLGVDTLLFLNADSAGQSTRELTLSYEVQAYNNALGLAAALAAVNDVTVVSDLTDANPATMTNKLDPDLAGDDVSDFLVNGVFIIDATQLLPETQVVTPTASPVTVGFDDSALLLELIIKSSGAPLDITGESCTFSNEAGTCIGGQNNLQVCDPSTPTGGAGGADCSVPDIFGQPGICANTGGVPISLPATIP